MKKEEFLKELEQELKGIDPEEIKEVLRDQDEFIRDAMSAGRAEAIVVKSLGSPKDFAKSIKLEHRIKKIKEAPTTWQTLKEALKSIGVLVALMPLNLLLFLGPGIVVLTFLFTWFMGSGAALVTSAILLITFILAGASFGFTAIHFVTTIFLAIGLICLSVAALALFFQVTKFFTNMFIKYINWNVNLVQRRAL